MGTCNSILFPKGKTEILGEQADDLCHFCFLPLESQEYIRNPIVQKLIYNLFKRTFISPSILSQRCASLLNIYMSSWSFAYCFFMPENFFFSSSPSWSQNYSFKHKSGYAQLVWSVVEWLPIHPEVDYSQGTWHMQGLRAQFPEGDMKEVANQYFSSTILSFSPSPILSF